MNEMQKVPSIVVMISGQGRSVENLIHYTQKSGTFTVSLVVSTRANSPVFSLLKKNKIPFEILPFQDFDKDLIRIMEINQQYKPNLYVLAGFLKKLPLPPWLKGKVINIHPSLLPLYGGPGMYGERVHEAVLAAKEEYSGASVHWVDESYDSGQIISQLKVRISDLKDSKAVSKRVFSAEKVLLPYTIEMLLK